MYTHRRAVISPATFFPRSARITRNNYWRNDAGNKPRVLRLQLRGTMKNIMRARVGGKVGKLIFIMSRSRTVDDIRIK